MTVLFMLAPAIGACGAAQECRNPIPPNQPIALARPCNDALVSWKSPVEGKTTIAGARVHVVVHPLDVNDYYVQPAVTVRSNGQWEISAYFGEDKPEHKGKRFEIMAVANPKHALKEGDILPGWPEAAAKSDVVLVTRR